MSATSVQLIALAGFEPQDRLAIAACLSARIAGQARYVVTYELQKAALVIGNADNAAVVKALSRRPASQKVLLLGNSDGGTGWPLLQRDFRVADLTNTIAGELDAELDSEPDSELPAPQLADTMAPEVFAQLKPKQQVLVVDDSEIALRLMHKRIIQLGAGVKLARSGQEALTEVATGTFTHVLLDTMMSGMDGFRICRAIKQHVFTDGQAPRVVLLTNLGASSDISRGKLAGCDDYLQKPVRTEELAYALGFPQA